MNRLALNVFRRIPSLRNFVTFQNAAAHQQRLQSFTHHSRNLNCTNQISFKRSFGAQVQLTLTDVRDRIMYVLRLYDKIDPEKLHEHSHFVKDLGLNSLDQVEIVIAIEDEFQLEIPDGVWERCYTPDDLIQYIGDRVKVAEFTYEPEEK